MSRDVNVKLDENIPPPSQRRSYYIEEVKNSIFERSSRRFEFEFAWKLSFASRCLVRENGKRIRKGFDWPKTFISGTKFWVLAIFLSSFDHRWACLVYLNCLNFREFKFSREFNFPFPPLPFPCPPTIPYPAPFTSFIFDVIFLVLYSFILFSFPFIISRQCLKVIPW